MADIITLYTMILCPFGRKVRLVLGEKKQLYHSIFEKPWAPSASLLACNPKGSVPVLHIPGRCTIVEEPVITEYLDEVYVSPPLIGRTPIERAEVRKLVLWFDQDFFHQVTVPISYEKIIKGLAGEGTPDSQSIRQGQYHLHTYLTYITWLCENRPWLGGGYLSMADFSAAAHLSCVDYTGDVPWDAYPAVKEWYMRIKSRPSFRALLHELVPGIPAVPVYKALDF